MGVIVGRFDSPQPYETRCIENEANKDPIRFLSDSNRANGTAVMRHSKAYNSQFTRSDDLPARKGPRPEAIRGPLHVQCNENINSTYVDQLLDQVVTWPHIEPAPTLGSRPHIFRIRVIDTAVTNEPSAFLAAREFGRVLLELPTIYLALPLVCAHWAIVRGWAELHYLTSFGLMPAGAVVLYTPRDEWELEVCHFLFSESYRRACSLVRWKGRVEAVSLESGYGLR